LQLFRARHSYVPRARFSTWLYRITSNACISELRRAEHRTASHSIDQPPADGEDPPDLPDGEGLNSEERVLEREKVDRLREMLRDLPSQQRAALLLARVEGLSYEDVAASLNSSVSAVKSLIHRATVTLRDRLREEI
ncbi:MAG TPA: RNA polymerase sigma factor, partial [Candidatus Acidoferrales bacterium]|nr:RNA polymerase sigma factor [Candidatus Acidoferrales bacterium]